MSIQQKYFISFLSFIFFMFFTGIISAETLTYNLSTSAKDIKREIAISKIENGFLVKTITENKDEMEYTTDESFSIIKWKYYNAQDGTDITAERSGNTISISGKLKNEKLEKKLEIDNTPWYQEWEFGFCLKDFIVSDKNSAYFSAINPENLKIYKFEVNKDKTETIEVNNNKVESVHVKISFTGFLKLFWGANMWFRKSDGIFILSKMNQGPGTPMRTIQLMEEKQMAALGSIDILNEH